MLALLFSGLLASGNVTQPYDGEDNIYHWWGLGAGLLALAGLGGCRLLAFWRSQQPRAAETSTLD